jgi:hypothetical protein
MRLRAIDFGLLTLALLAGPMAANASVVSYDFTITGTSGPSMGLTSNGSFSFDTSVIPSGGGFVDATGLLSSLTFSWNGIAYSAATANTGRLFFDASANLIQVFFGTNCGFTNGMMECSVHTALDQWYLFGGPTTLGLTYASSHEPGIWVGGGSYAPVPLPAGAWLLLSGLAGLGFAGLGHRAVAALGDA